MQTAPDEQILLTGPDARFMATSKSRNGMVGYNVQTAVETRHHQIVAHDVTNIANDRGQLSTMARDACSAMGASGAFTTLADEKLLKGENMLACDEAGIAAYMPKPRISNNKAARLFDKRDFIYDAEKDEYRCLAGQALKCRFTAVEQGKTPRGYRTSNCQPCELKPECAMAKERHAKRWEHEAMLDAMQQRLDTNQYSMLIRKQTTTIPSVRSGHG